ncbi:MAG: energy transducer TonB [Bacteroidota bacterium]
MPAKKGSLLLSGLIFFVQASGHSLIFKCYSDTTKPLYDLLYGPKTNSVDSNMLVVVNGQILGTLRVIKKDINSIFSPDTIEKINVWKGSVAIEKFGEDGKYGVTEFILKGYKPGYKQSEIIVESKPVSGKKPVEKIQKVDIESAYPGGLEAYRKFLERNINGQIAEERGARAGRYTAVVQFIIDTTGNIFDVIPLTNHGYGMEDELVGLFRKTKWKPTIIDGRPVKVAGIQSVTFTATGDFYVPKKRQ